MQTKHFILMGENDDDTRPSEVLQKMLPSIKRSGYYVCVSEDKKKSLAETIEIYEQFIKRNAQTVAEFRQNIDGINNQYGEKIPNLDLVLKVRGFIRSFADDSDKFEEHKQELFISSGENLIFQLQELLQSKTQNLVTKEDVARYIDTKIDEQYGVLRFDSTQKFIELLKSIQENNIKLND